MIDVEPISTDPSTLNNLGKRVIQERGQSQRSLTVDFIVLVLSIFNSRDVESRPVWENQSVGLLSEGPIRESWIKNNKLTNK